jgi:hypothetical protein
MEDSTTLRDKAPPLPGDALLFLGLVAALGIALFYSVRTFPTAERTAVRNLYRAYRKQSPGQQRSGHERRQDCDLPENSSENLERKLDHALEETFPTSDPVSVKITR